MKVLEDIWNDRLYQQEISFTNNIGLMLQPCSFTDFHCHPEFAEAYRLFTQNDSFRGLDFARIWSMVLNAKHALNKCTGSLAELGVYQGQSSALLSFYARQFGRKIYLADTFAGFAEQQYEEGMGEGKQNAFKDVSLDSARAVVGDYEGNRWIVGMFPNSVTDEMREDTYAFVSIDCDIYEPIIEGLRFFWPRMDAGGIIFIHDYSSGHWPGASRAVDEFCAQNGVYGCLLPDLAGSYVLVESAATLKPTDTADTRTRTPIAEHDRGILNPGKVPSGAAAGGGEPNLDAKRHQRRPVGIDGVRMGWPGLSRWFGGSPCTTEPSQPGNQIFSGSEQLAAGSTGNSPDQSWSPDTITDPTFRAKFIDVPDVIADWVRDYGGLSGRDVLDFGCYEAAAALGIALRCGARRVVGIEIYEEIGNAPHYAKSQLGLPHLPENLELFRLDAISPLEPLGTFDLVYSWSVFEHVNQDLIVDCLARIKRVLRPDGIMFLQTTPLFYSGEGSHLKPWIPTPWAHLTMQQDLFYAALRKATNSQEQTDQLWWLYETRNRVTAPQLIRAAQQAGFEIVKEYRTYDEISPPDELKEIYAEETLTTNQLVFIARHASSSSE